MTESNKILYFEAPDGISGDMVLGALIDLGVDVEAVKRELDTLVPGEYSLTPQLFERNGIYGTNLNVLVSEEQEECIKDNNIHDNDKHLHRHYCDIKKMIEGSGIPERAKLWALAIFDVIAEAEAAVHRTGKEEVAFHEVGAMDSIIDIVGTAVAIDIIGITDLYCAAPHDGSGTITCRHGRIPVPVPAVIEMAKGSDIPIVIENEVLTEMITPTGFGIIKGLGMKFEPSLGIIPEKTGYGFGKRDTGRLGAVRVTLGLKYEEEQIETDNYL